MIKIIFATILSMVLFLSSSSYDVNTISLNVTWSRIISEPTIGLDWDPNGDSIVSLIDSWDEVILLNWQSGEITQRVALPHLEYAPEDYIVKWSPDGQSIVVPKGNVYLLDPENGDIRILREARENSGYFNADWGLGSELVAALSTDGNLDIISIQTGEIEQTIDIVGGDGWRDSLLYYYFDWSTDGNLFAAPHRMSDIAGEPPVVAFWDQEGAVLNVYTRESSDDTAPQISCSANADFFQYMGNVMWANDNRTLAISGGDGIGICRLNIDGTISQQRIDNPFGSDFSWSPDQMWLASRILNDDNCSLWLAAVAENYQTYQLQIDSQPCHVYGLAWSPDSQHLAVSTDSGIWIGTFSSE